MRVLIASCIRQSTEILREFLVGLDELNNPESVDYYFILDSLSSSELDLFIGWKGERKNIKYEEIPNNLPYFKNEYTHHWKTDLVKHVAFMKDKILEEARMGKYDYLFFTDSDQVFHPNTLLHLINQGKDIIGEISWAKWRPNEEIMPNAWFRHPYDFDGRLIELLEKTVHEVKGFGGCYLISKRALDTPISWRMIEKHPTWGEDRHFAIRAEELGWKLYIDATYPYFHIYRKGDLPKLIQWKKRGYVEESIKVEKGTVLIGVCVGEKEIHPDTAAWITLTLRRQPKWGLEISRAHPIDSNRNMIVRKFMLIPDAQKYEWLLFLDTDVVPPRGGVETLLSTGKKVVGGVCPIMGVDGYPIWNISKDMEAGFVKAELIEVNGMGTGFMLIHRSVLEKVGHPAFRFRYDPWGTASICGEDYDFCEKVVKAGYKIYADLSVQCEHYKEVGLLQLNRKLADIINRENDE